MRKLFSVLTLAVAALLATVAQATTVREVPTKNVPGPALVTIAVPEGYDAAPEKHYPTVYLLNGHGGDHKSWPTVIDVDSLATAHEVIIVCPAGQNSWYFDSPVNPKMQMESYITKDLVPWIDANYRTIKKPEQRAITGLSMGGHGALWLAFNHPDLFLNCGSTSGGVDFTPWPKSWNIPDALGPYATNKRRWADHTVMSKVPDLPRGRYNIIFDCGTSDFFFKVNNRLHTELQKRGIVHKYLTSPGAHSQAYWHRSIVPQMNFFSEKFKEVK